MTTIPIGRAAYPARATRVSLRNSATASAAAAGEPRLAGGADQAAADDHAVGDLARPRPPARRCRSRSRPRPGPPASALVAATSSASAAGSSAALAGRADGRDDVDEAAGDGADPAAALGRGRRRDQRHQRQPGRGEGVADVLGLAERQVGDDRPGGAGGDAPARRTPRPRRARGPCSRRPSAPPGPGRRPPRRPPARSRSVAPASSAARRRGVDRRPVGERVGERDPELDQIGARIRVGARRPPARSRGRGTRPSCTASAPPGPRPWRLSKAARDRAPDAGADATSAIEISAIATHLGQVLVAAPGEAENVEALAARAFSKQPGDRVGGLQRRDDPLQPRELAEGGQRLRRR